MAQKHEKFDALKKVKENFDPNFKATNAEVHFVTGKEGENVTISSLDLPAKPTLHFKANKNCTFHVTEGTSLVKVLLEDCHDCTFVVNGSIITSTMEIWSSQRCNVHLDVKIGTMQVDMCRELKIACKTKEQLESVVQAGVFDLTLLYGDEEHKTGLQHLRELHSDQDINETTDQFITRWVDGELLHERVLRLANDFPTTQREKEQFDRKAEGRAEQLEAMIRAMLGDEEREASLSEEEKAELAKLRKEAKEARAKAREDDASVGARALFKKNEGNASFKIKDYQQAAVFYTEAILIKDDDHTFYSNRAQCFLKLGGKSNAEKALADADLCIKLAPEFVKGHFRRGVALLGLERFEEAAQSLIKALDLEPSNQQAKDTLQMAKMKAHRARSQR